MFNTLAIALLATSALAGVVGPQTASAQQTSATQSAQAAQAAQAAGLQDVVQGMSRERLGRIAGVMKSEVRRAYSQVP
jgi:hypothetical protein